LFLGPIALIGLKSLLRKHLIADLFPDSAAEALLEETDAGAAVGAQSSGEDGAGAEKEAADP
jgi:hypothetical protein